MGAAAGYIQQAINRRAERKARVGIPERFKSAVLPKASSASALLFLLCSCATTVPERNLAIGATVADVATTTVGVNRGYTEANPIYGARPDAGRVLAINAAIIAGVWWTTKDMEIRTQRRIWRWIAALRIGAVSWNTIQLTKRGG